MTAPAFRPAQVGYSSYVRTVTVLDPAGSLASSVPPMHVPYQVYLDDLDVTGYLLTGDDVGPEGLGPTSPAVTVETHPAVVVTLGLVPTAVDISTGHVGVSIAGRDVLCPVDYARYVYGPPPTGVRWISDTDRRAATPLVGIYVRMYAAEILFRTGKPPITV